MELVPAVVVEPVAAAGARVAAGAVAEALPAVAAALPAPAVVARPVAVVALVAAAARPMEAAGPAAVGKPEPEAARAEAVPTAARVVATSPSATSGACRRFCPWRSSVSSYGVAALGRKRSAPSIVCHGRRGWFDQVPWLTRPNARAELISCTFAIFMIVSR
jgi:hypothetical protein